MIEKAKKRQNIINTNIIKAKTAYNIHGHESEQMFQKFNLVECASYLQHKFHENDVAMQKLVGKRRKHCMKVMQYESLTSCPQTSDIKDDWADDSSPDPDVIDVLMGLSLSMMDVSVD